MLRLLLAAAGIVLMISGCNGLLSTGFGTHKLRTLSYAEATLGVGDADYLAITEARKSGHERQRTLRNGDSVVLLPLRGATMDVAVGRVVVWGAPAILDSNDPSGRFEGFVEVPDTVALNDRTVRPSGTNGPITYLHVGERPTAAVLLWAMFTGGLLLALLPEYLHHRRTTVQ